MRETDSERKKGKGVSKGQREILVHSEWKEGEAEEAMCANACPEKKILQRRKHFERGAFAPTTLDRLSVCFACSEEWTASSLDPMTKENVRDREHAYLLLFAFSGQLN